MNKLARESEKFLRPSNKDEEENQNGGRRRCDFSDSGGTASLSIKEGAFSHHEGAEQHTRL